MKHWLQAFRLRTLPLAVSSILVGSALATNWGWVSCFVDLFRPVILVLALLTAILLQILSNLANDLGDHQHGTDNADRVGPQRAVQSGAISSAVMWRAMAICGSLAFVSGCALITVALGLSLTTLAFLFLGLAAIGAAVKYTFGSNPYGYAGFGDVSVFLFFGIVGVCGTFYLHTSHFEPMVLLPAVGFGLLSAGVLNVNNMRDIINDEASGKRTLVVRMGGMRAKRYHAALVLGGLASLVIFQFVRAWLDILAIPGRATRLRDPSEARVFDHGTAYAGSATQSARHGHLLHGHSLLAGPYPCVMLRARWIEHTLRPRFELGTSKGPITARTVWYLMAWHRDRPEVQGFGEAALFPGHSKEFPADVRTKLLELCADTSNWEQRLRTDLVDVPSVRFAVEQCLRDLEAGGSKMLFPSEFTLGRQAIPINGLVWMGDKATMQRIREQIDGGYSTVKMKIGAIGIEDELTLLKNVRAEYKAADLTLRVDANGAFSAQQAPEVLKRLADLQVHSIEQPVAPGLYEVMTELCADPPIPIALDEDLIGANTHDAKVDLLDNVRPQYIVIKPSLVGGWAAAQEWIDLAKARNIGWWITSALESSIGLNAIAQFTATLNVTLAQGLGTGKVYENNIPSPLLAEKGFLRYRPEAEWDLSTLQL
ncbi:MAG: 1,4-dihydroxy-2-naphthoate octaprenyltransferase [Flavobacteriales bacterium]|nr:1,4-dihydroxy-2-naphthoate octaprenyltransferase [Flavobacteriales bacterium]